MDLEHFFTNVTEKAAIACFDWIGKGDEKLSDKAAVSSMREELNKIDINGKIVIGEGERDCAPMLYIGEHVGTGNGQEIDIAVDPLEGTTICANGTEGALSVLAASSRNSLLNAPDIYMNKIAIGPNLPDGVIAIEASVKENLQNLAKAKKCQISDIVVTILARERHRDLISQARETGAKIRLIQDGDIAAVISTSVGFEHFAKTDLYLGIGGAPEGVIAAAALKTTGGQFFGKLVYKDDNERKRAKMMGVDNLDRTYSLEDLVKDHAIFVATAITNSLGLKGVEVTDLYIKANSLVINSVNRKIGVIQNIYSKKDGKC